VRVSDASTAERAAAATELGSTRAAAERDAAERDREIALLKREVDESRLENTRLASAIDEHTRALAVARAEARAQVRKAKVLNSLFLPLFAAVVPRPPFLHASLLHAVMRFYFFSQPFVFGVFVLRCSNTTWYGFAYIVALTNGIM
jgi:hypothetical protein